MFLSDFHLHSKFSFDGHEELETICEAAIERGMQQIAVTDHCDIYTNKEYGYIIDFETEYPKLKEIQAQFADRLTVKIGIELGQPMVNPKEAEKFIHNFRLDFIIGSLHNMEKDIDVGDYDYDKEDCVKVYGHYLEWLYDLAKNYEYDVLGHVTYPLRYMAVKGKYPDINLFEEQLKEIYKTAISRGKGIELNTSGLYQDIKETMPSVTALKWYKECGGEIITIGSDAHYAKYVGQPICEGMKILKECGFKAVATYSDRKPVFHDIT